MQFDWNIIFTIIAVVIMIACIRAWAWENYSYARRPTAADTLLLWARGLLIVVVVYAILCACALFDNFAMANYTVEQDSHPVRGATYQSLAEHFGFASGKAYPLVLGSISGSGQDSKLTVISGHGLFFSYNKTTLNTTSPSALVPVTITEQNGNKVRVDLPANHLQFKTVSSTDDSSVAITLSGKTSKSAGTQSWTPSYPGCKWTTMDFVPWCADSPTGTWHTTLSPTAINYGLANPIDAAYSYAVISLTQQQYDQLDGTIN